MDVSYAIANLLQISGFGTVGSDICVGYMPDGENVIMIAHAGGRLHEYTPMQETVIDIYVKHIGAEAAIATLERIKQSIHRLHNTQYNNVYMYSILVIGDVEEVDRDLEHAKIYKITVNVVNRSLALIS